MESSVKVREYKKGEIIVRQGDVEMCMYDVLSGVIGIYVNYGLPNEKLLTELKSGAYFGEMGLVDAMPRSATAIALEDATVQVIDGDAFSAYFAERPEKVLAIMQHMSARIRSLTNDYMDACKVAAETLEAERTGKEKSGWLKKNLIKFAEAYAESAYYTDIMFPGNYIGLI